MPQTADPIAQGEDVNTWLRGMTESLTHKTCELLLFLIIILILRRLLTHDSSQNNNHEELVKITSSLSYAFTAQLHLSDKHITHLQEELTRAQSRIDKREVKVQDQLKAPNEREQETMEQVKKLQAALGAAQCDQQQANAAQKDLNNNHEELVKITSSLSYAFTAQLHLSDKHITHLQEELTRAQSRIDKLEVKVQDQLKAPNEREQETMEQVKKLQAALGAAQCDQQQANAAQKDLSKK
ncbi:coiled-coil domain-containing protein 102B-like [Labeo rohita]|uniref:Coiled-coil domain-containing protein 102B-like n=1 Tax=Labeo rohita TaxID=84645 RepID=A0A498M0H4_LABRO|nr:coiled-coil domain-containing protein 102B-like [Labeo rohita]